MGVRSPFTPTFGVTPPLLVGRGDLLDEFDDALDAGPGAPGRATVYTGGRGTGKTVMLNEVEDLARRRGWQVVSESATPGLVDRLTHEVLPALLAEMDPSGPASTLTGLTALGRGRVVEGCIGANRSGGAR